MCWPLFTFLDVPDSTTEVLVSVGLVALINWGVGFFSTQVMAHFGCVRDESWGHGMHDESWVWLTMGVCMLRE